MGGDPELVARAFTAASSHGLSVDSTPVTVPPITMACWAKVNNLTAENPLLWIGDKDFGDQMYVLSAAGNLVGDPLVAMVGSGTYTWAASPVPYPTGVWFLAVAVFAATNDRLVYINTSATFGEDTVTRLLTQTPDRVGIGRYMDSTPGPSLDGEIAEVAIWNVTLGQAHIDQLAKGVPASYIRPDKLVLYADLLGRQSPEPDKRGGRSFVVTGAVQSTHPPIRHRPQSLLALFGAPPTVPSSTAISGSQLRIITPNGSTGYGGVRSKIAYDLTTSYFSAELTDAGIVVANTDREAYIAAVVDPSNEVRFRVTGTALEARKKVGAAWTTVATTTYSPTNHYGLRISESGGTTSWDVRTAGGAWTSFFSAANPVVLTNVELQVAAGNVNSTTAATVVFDNVNLDPIPAGAEEDIMLLLHVG